MDRDQTARAVQRLTEKVSLHLDLVFLSKLHDQGHYVPDEVVKAIAFHTERAGKNLIEQMNTIKHAEAFNG